jgi:hypothetical protein
MTRLSLALIATALLFAACGGGAGATPEETFEALQSAVKARDWGKFHDLLSEEGRSEFRDDYEDMKTEPEEAAEELGMEASDVAELEFRDYFIKMMEVEAERMGEMLEQFVAAEILDIQEMGDRAEVTFRIGDDEETMRMEKVGGAWLITDLG